MRLETAIACAVTACTNTPMVIAVTGEPELGREAIEAWGALGFTYTDGPADLIIHVSIEPHVSDDCGCRVRGHADGTRITLDPLLVGDELRHTARHEFGHVLLDAMHLESYINPPWGYEGIMRASPDTTKPPVLEPTADDLALACHTIGVCI